jgi:replicative DNA helicase
MRERGDVIEEEYKAGRVPNWRSNGRLQNIFVCPKSSLTVSDIQTIIMRSELKIGRRPVLAMVDYAQLLNGLGKSRYEKMTDVMKDLKSMAKETGTIVVVASQILRKRGDESEDVGVNDGKDSGQIENSASLMLGAWQQKDDPSTLNLRVLKNTKGFPGLSIQCNFDGARGIITERVERM